MDFEPVTEHGGDWNRQVSFSSLKSIHSARDSTQGSYSELRNPVISVPQYERLDWTRRFLDVDPEDVLM